MRFGAKGRVLAGSAAVGAVQSLHFRVIFLVRVLVPLGAAAMAAECASFWCRRMLLPAMGVVQGFALM